MSVKTLIYGVSTSIHKQKAHERSIILKYMKTKKVWYQLIFIAAIVTSGFGSLEVWAAEQSGYTGCSSSILKMVTVRNQFRDLLRNIEFNILSFLADVIDFSIKPSAPCSSSISLITYQMNSVLVKWELS